MGCFVLGQAHNSEKDRDTETQYLTAKVLPYEFMLVLNINDIMVLISLSIIIILLLLGRSPPITRWLGFSSSSSLVRHP